MYDATKSCVLSGTSPWTSTASQFTKATKNAAMPRSADPDDERDREEDPEDHRETGALEVVADDESDRSLLSARHGRILPQKGDGSGTRSFAVPP